VCGAGPLAINDLVEISGVRNIGSMQSCLLAVPPAHRDSGG
jgi:hypothetical protein